MVDSTPTAGNLLKGGVLFLHNSGIDNTFLGKYAGNGTLTASGQGQNTGIGVNALFNTTTGFQNTAHGSQALFSNATGWGNTGTGYRALYANTGYNNTATGNQALLGNTTGFENTALGCMPSGATHRVRTIRRWVPAPMCPRAA